MKPTQSITARWRLGLEMAGCGEIDDAKTIVALFRLTGSAG